MRLAVAACLVGLALIGGCARKPLPTYNVTISAISTHPPKPRAVDVFKRANDERHARGLRKLQWDQRLANYAIHWSHVMSHEHRMHHSDIGSLLGPYNYVGENIAYGSRGVSVSQLHVGWMKSPDHRSNILAPGFTKIGVGFACGVDGKIWATVNFARRTSAGTPPAAPRTTPERPIVRTDHDNLGCP